MDEGVFLKDISSVKFLKTVEVDKWGTMHFALIASAQKVCALLNAVCLGRGKTRSRPLFTVNTRATAIWLFRPLIESSVNEESIRQLANRGQRSHSIANLTYLRSAQLYCRCYREEVRKIWKNPQLDDNNLNVLTHWFLDQDFQENGSL